MIVTAIHKKFTYLSYNSKIKQNIFHPDTEILT